MGLGAGTGGERCDCCLPFSPSSPGLVAEMRWMFAINSAKVFSEAIGKCVRTTLKRK
jgi:hypothetical protein